MTDVESRGRRLLLISNSTLYSSGYLDHAEKEIRDFLGAVSRVLFVPFAQHDHDAYAASARRRLEAMGYELDPDPTSTHMGETQEERINQFLEENNAPVVGLREGAMLRIEQGNIQLKGITAARVLRRGHCPVEIEPGSNLGALLAPAIAGGNV